MQHMAQIGLAKLDGQFWLYQWKGYKLLKCQLDLYNIRNKVAKYFFWYLILLQFFFLHFYSNISKQGILQVIDKFAAAWPGIHNKGPSSWTNYCQGEKKSQSPE